MKLNEQKNIAIRKAKFLEVTEAYEVIFWSASGLKHGISDSSWFSAEGDRNLCFPCILLREIFHAEQMKHLSADEEQNV